MVCAQQAGMTGDGHGLGSMRVSRGLQNYTPENIDNRHISSASPTIGETPRGLENRACENIDHRLTADKTGAS